MASLLTLTACLLFTAYGGLIVAYRRVWKTIPLFVPQPADHRIKITVLIPARNEEENIVECLQSLALQTYPYDCFEVIVLDDYSTDGTVQAVRNFAGSSLTLRCLEMANVPRPSTMTAYKKFAIETGIGEAAGELIVTTDADCQFDPHWLSMLAACYIEKGAKFIAAPVRIAMAHRSLLAVFQTLDFITLQGITGAAAHSRFHSMCNGANLAYARETFYEVQGFKDIDSIPSGDDLLLMHKIYRRYPEKIFFLKSQQAIVTTRAATNWKDFFHQRVRWASKADTYDDKRIFWVLLLVYLVNVIFLALLAGAFFNFWWLWLLLFLLTLKTIVEYPFVRDVATFFGQQRLMPWFPVLQPLHIAYTIVVGWLGKFGSYVWKDRKIDK